MLFDLRGRGRRRAIQAIYLTLAVLMGGGLIFFGIGGNTSGGLFDAFSSNSSSSGNDVVEKRLETLEKRTVANPRDAGAWAGLAKARFQVAQGGENFDSNQGLFTTKGLAELRKSEVAWDRYVALDPAKIDPSLAAIMVRAFGPAGLAKYDKAVVAQEAVIDGREPTWQLYGELAVYAHGAKQERKSTLAEDKAVELAPKGKAKDVRTSIQQAKTQLDQQAAVEQPQSG